MRLFKPVIAALFVATPVLAEQNITINWPSFAREGDRYVAELLGADANVIGQYVISVSPNDISVIDVDVEGATNVCFFSVGNARYLNALTGTYFGGPIALVPELNSGKICLSLFDNKSSEWHASI